MRRSAADRPTDDHVHDNKRPVSLPPRVGKCMRSHPRRQQEASLAAATGREMHAIPPAATGDPAHQRAAVAAASPERGRGRRRWARRSRRHRAAHHRRFEPSPAAATRGGGEGVRRPMNPPWFTCPQAGRGGAAMVHPLTKRPATRGGAALPSKAEGAGCPPPTREGSWGCPTSSLPLSLFVVVGRRCPGRT